VLNRKTGKGSPSTMGTPPGSMLGDCVDVLDCNSLRHFELHCAIRDVAAVMLQINRRLGPEDLGFVIQ
jgi:hypothetical protein